MNSLKKITLICSVLVLCSGKPVWNVDPSLKYCAMQAEKTLALVPKDNDTLNIPRSISNGSTQWRFVGYKDWTSGFWPGILWYVYEFNHSGQIKAAADKFSRELTPLSQQPAYDHDLGFQIFNCFGHGYRLTQNPAYKKIILATADTLATLYNPKVGTILSWPRMVQAKGWPHNTIIDNMINLEMLFWAAKNGGSKNLYDIAIKHAETTMNNHFRPDFTSYHVVVYDTITGQKLQGMTHQGYSDNSMWARGQSWAIYGFTMVYRETKDPRFLGFAQKVSDVYLKNLPTDLIPYWDFNDPALPNAPRDASAACVTASALLELSGFVKDKAKAQMYRSKAEKMLQELSTEKYMGKDKNSAFLLHSTGHKPNGGEIDASIIYADYYYIEALLRLKKLKAGKNIYQNL